MYRTLIDCANIWNRSEAAKQPFLYWIEWITLNYWIYPVSIVKNTYFEEHLLMAASDFLKQLQNRGEELLLYWLFY